MSPSKRPNTTFEVDLALRPTVAAEVEWLAVKPGSVWLGNDDGKISLYPIKYSPRHEVRIDYPFEITKRAYPIRVKQGESKNFPEVFPTEDYEGEGLRPPTEAEWDLAYSQGLVKQEKCKLETLSDRRVIGGYWGQRCDGYPRTTSHRMKMKLSKIWEDDGPKTISRSATPFEVRKEEMIRLVRLAEKDREKAVNPPRLPSNEGEKKAILLRELLLALFIGIAPAFLWAYNFARPEYISSGWPSIAFGGLVFSIFTGFLWRPKRPSYHVSEKGKRMEKCDRACSHND